jgi:hypothetical protein
VPRPVIHLLIAAQAVLLLHTSPHAAGMLLPSVDSPAGGGGSVVLEPVRQRAQPARRLIYSCVEPGLITYSDRPCGPLSEVRELNVQQPPSSGAGTAPKPGNPGKVAEMSDMKGPGDDKVDPGDGEVGDGGETTCQKLQATLDTLDSRMRTGYSAREAGMLWQRWRETKARLHAANC